MDNIKIAPKEKFTHTPTQLKNLIEAAQRGEQQAIERLCHDFAPLIYKEARRTSVQSALGEDAVNTAWVIFLEFIQKYKGNNYRLLPGLVQKHVHYKLIDKLHQKGCLLDCDALDADDNAKAAIVDNRDYFAESDNKLSVENAIKKLSSQQQAIIRQLIMEGVNINEVISNLGCNKGTCYTYKKRALKHLKKYLTA